MPDPGHPTLVRAIGRWSLAALMVNIVIGSGIFGLPAAAAAKTGRKSPLSFLIAAAGIAVIAACFAEVASRFRGSGGPYLYTRAAFGRFVGLQTGWLTWLSRLTATAASANLFAAYVAAFWPRVSEPRLRVLAITLLVAALTAINIRGVKMGTGVSNLLTASKLVPLVVFVFAGCGFLILHGSPVPSVPQSYDAGTWLSSVLLVIFAYMGFEAALIPAGEAANPDRDAPVAMLAALGICTPIYVLIQFVVVNVLQNPAQSDRPLAAAALAFGGSLLSTVIALGVLLSVVGYIAANLIACPRIIFAFAEQGEFPTQFAAIHPRFKTPYVAILVFAILVWALAVKGTFSWNVKLSSVSRLIIYLLTCLALPTLRWKFPGKEKFHLPLGLFFALLGVVFCVAVLSRAGKVEAVVLGVVITIALLNWIVVRLRPANAANKERAQMAD